ncbi:amino acid transporter [Dickeya sp. CFBP 2040]|uniref:Amino acid transporter n=1 Tax=Dickeya poaceiphila TaxID=568768 RepID=A0A5B8IA69_9GAMM|nr:MULTISPECIES: LysE/ArgO family amino acid transporter [Dickeya]NKI73691.1 amino acid transporter [Dickeya sp. CFBP 2040]QDX31482.1 amino acid transporter [Dickeya poaceiphila]
MPLPVFITGFMTGAGLIVAIGAQNSFVLRQGMRREHVFWVSSVCFLCDLVLMTLGVLGLGKIINDSKPAITALTLAGALFLLWYGYNTLKSAWRGNNQLTITSQADGLRRRTVISASLAVSLLNPHVYLDTVVIIGGISSGIAPDLKLCYLAGTVSASLLWFYTIGYMAAACSRYFANPTTWRVIDSLIGCYMIFMALQLCRLLYQ